jgi:hypothetical protein
MWTRQSRRKRQNDSVIPSCIQTVTIYKRHCEYFVAQHKLSEAIPGPDLAFMNVLTERHSCRISGNSSIFKSRRASRSRLGLGTGRAGLPAIILARRPFGGTGGI